MRRSRTSSLIAAGTALLLPASAAVAASISVNMAVWPIVDNQVVALPEPSSAILLGTFALLGLALRRR